MKYWDSKSDEIFDLEPDWCHSILSEVKDLCLIYLSEKITELQYGGLMSSIIDRMRVEIDTKLSKLNNEATNELQSIYVILSSGKTETDWSKVAHSSRRIFKIVADCLFPPQDEPYIDSHGKSHKVKDNDYMNRLLAFVDKKKGSDFLLTDFDKLREFFGKGEHSMIDRLQAEQIAVHTYLILSEILRLVQSN